MLSWPRDKYETRLLSTVYLVGTYTYVYMKEIFYVEIIYKIYMYILYICKKGIK